MFQRFIQKGLIEPAELKAVLGENNVRILDVSYVMPNSGTKPYDNFLKSRIPGAQFFDIETASDKSSPLPHMLPGVADFEKILSTLGIHNDDFIVVYGQGDMAMGPARAWWMFRVFGHDNVVVLNGGLKAWQAEDGEVDISASRHPKKTSYKVTRYRENLVCDMGKMVEVSENKTCSILDARPKERFDGTQAEPRAGLRSGHIPGSFSIPAAALVIPETGKMKPESDLRVIFYPYLKSTNFEIILTCGSGVTACMLALGLFTLGYKKFSVYDGSWAEWGQTNSMTKISVTK